MWRQRDFNIELKVFFNAVCTLLLPCKVCEHSPVFILNRYEWLFMSQPHLCERIPFPASQIRFGPITRPSDISLTIWKPELNRKSIWQDFPRYCNLYLLDFMSIQIGFCVLFALENFTPINVQHVTLTIRAKFHRHFWLAKQEISEQFHWQDI